MSTPLLPFDVWTSQITQASVPANNNAIRSEIISAKVISKTTTAQPTSPTDGDLYIIPSSATGAQWTTFSAGDLAIYKSGTWYAFAPNDGLVKMVNTTLEVYSGGSWSVV